MQADLRCSLWITSSRLTQFFDSRLPGVRVMRRAPFGCVIVAMDAGRFALSVLRSPSALRFVAACIPSGSLSGGTYDAASALIKERRIASWSSGSSSILLAWFDREFGNSRLNRMVSQWFPN